MFHIQVLITRKECTVTPYLCRNESEETETREKTYVKEVMTIPRSDSLIG